MGWILMNVNGGCGRSPWSVTNLCPVVLLWPLKDIWMYVWLPGLPCFSHNLYCMSSSSYWVVLQETSAINPSICASITFHPCACESVCFHDEQLNILCRWIRDYSNMTDQIRGAKRCETWMINSEETNQTVLFSFPPCVDDLLCPDSVVLTACLCSFCHTKVMSSASAHNCLIPLDAKLELFALLQMNMGILRRVQIAILI